MAKNYAKPFGYGSDNAPKVTLPAPFAAQTRYYSENGATASVITFTDDTTQIEVGTGGATGALIRWVNSSIASSGTAGLSSVNAVNFDHFVPPNTVRQFVVPVDPTKNSVTSIVGANVQNGLYKTFSIKNIGAGSVITTEY